MKKTNTKFLSLVLVAMWLLALMSPVYAGKVENNEYIVDSTDTAATIKTAIANPDVNALRFSENISIDITSSFTIQKEFTIFVDDNITVDINAGASKATGFRVVLNKGETFKVENNGTINFNNVARAFWVSGNTDASFELVGPSKDTSIMNINDNTGYAIAAMDHYSGHSLIENMTINTNSTKDNAESAIYLGNQSAATVKISNSELNLINNSDKYTSSAFASNANLIDIVNSEINSSSRAHYNFNTYNILKTTTDETSRQIVNFKSSKLNLNTPTDSNPHRSKWGFTLPQDAVGMNSSNTVFNVIEGSSITHNVNDFNRGHLGLELEGSKLFVEDGNVDFRSLGFDKNIGISEVIIEDNSKATIDKITGNNARHLPNIVISGGSVLFKENVPAGTNVVNQFEEPLEEFIIPSTNFKDNGTINIPVNPDNDSYEGYNYKVNLNMVHEENAHIWTPAVNVFFYSSKEDATKDTNKIDDASVKLPRGANIVLVGKTTPDIDRGHWVNLETEKNYTDEDFIPKDTKVYSELTGNVKINYVDKDGNSIKDSVNTAEEKVGTDYDVSTYIDKTISKEGATYNYLKTEGEETGKIINDTIAVSFIYEKVVEDDTPGNSVIIPYIPETPETPETPIKEEDIPKVNIDVPKVSDTPIKEENIPEGNIDVPETHNPKKTEEGKTLPKTDGVPLSLLLLGGVGFIGLGLFLKKK